MRERPILFSAPMVRAILEGRMTLFPEYGERECIREGFPHFTPRQFINFFCATHKGCTPETEITRIEFRVVSG